MTIPENLKIAKSKIKKQTSDHEKEDPLWEMRSN